MLAPPSCIQRESSTRSRPSRRWRRPLNRAVTVTTTSQPDQSARVKIFGKSGSALGYMIRDFLHRSDVPFEWIEASNDDQAQEDLPVCIFPDGTRLECPTIRQITEK